MLIPIGTNVEHRRYPAVTYWLIGINILIFAGQWAIARAGGLNSTNELVQTFASIENACRLSSIQFHFYSLFTYQFLHADWLHILFNMIFLLPFGKVVEDRMGHLGFLVFYLGCGAIGGYLHTLVHVNPVVGASGSVCAVVAAFVVLAPKTKTHILFVFFLIGVYSVPSMLLVAFYISIDVLSQAASLLGRNTSNTAWIVHLTGYFIGGGCTYIALKLHFISSSEFDLPRVLQQWKRRRDYKSTLSTPPVRQVPDSSDDPDFLLRPAIADKVNNGELELATAMYLEENKKNSSFSIDGMSLHSIGISLLQNNNTDLGVKVLEKYLSQQKNAKDKGDVALLLIAKYTRVLGNKKRAKSLLQTYEESFSDTHTALAETLKEELNK